jgi:hypothetical protein
MRRGLCHACHGWSFKWQSLARDTKSRFFGTVLFRGLRTITATWLKICGMAGAYGMDAGRRYHSRPVTTHWSFSPTAVRGDGRLTGKAAAATAPSQSKPGCEYMPAKDTIHGDISRVNLGPRTQVPNTTLTDCDDMIFTSGLTTSVPCISRFGFMTKNRPRLYVTKPILIRPHANGYDFQFVGFADMNFFVYIKNDRPFGPVKNFDTPSLRILGCGLSQSVPAMGQSNLYTGPGVLNRCFSQ